MYYDYFGLNQPPFKITPDTSMFFPGGNRGAILDAMIYAITSGEGIVKVVGEVGSGKTMLCRMLEVELPENVEIVYLANPSLSPDDIIHAIAFELKLDVVATEDRIRVMNSLQNYLLEKHANNHQVVIFVEEAQSMPLATLEEIRLLSNLETGQNKLLQIVLFGQPELDEMIAKKEIRQLKERITYSFNLNPLRQDEIRDYLYSRLRSCGYRSGDLFTARAIKAITGYSRGLLRRVNILADKSLLAAYAGNTHRVTRKQVRQAANDSEFVTGIQKYRYSFLAMGLATVMLLISLWFFPFEKFKDSLSDKLDITGNQVEPSEELRVTAEQLPGKNEVKPDTPFKTIYHQQDHSSYYDYLGRDEGAFLFKPGQNLFDHGLISKPAIRWRYIT